MEDRQSTVAHNLQRAVQCVGRLAQFDEEGLREPANRLRDLWTLELLSPDEAEIALAAY